MTTIEAMLTNLPRSPRLFCLLLAAEYETRAKAADLMVLAMAADPSEPAFSVAEALHAAEHWRASAAEFRAKAEAHPVCPIPPEVARLLGEEPQGGGIPTTVLCAEHGVHEVPVCEVDEAAAGDVFTVNAG